MFLAACKNKVYFRRKILCGNYGHAESMENCEKIGSKMA